MPPEKIIPNREVLRKVIQELREIRDHTLPTPQEDWDLIWVLSGPELLEEEPVRGRNESKDRLQTGFTLAQEVTAKRLGKQPVDVTIEEMRTNGPRLYYNGRDQQNDELRNACSKGTIEEKYHFPRENLEIAPPDSYVTHTGHQFERFPPTLLVNKRKIVIVSSARHLPRVQRYVGLDSNPFKDTSMENLIFYPAQPINFPFSTRGEIRKISPYQDQGLLRKEG